jgi:uncharacterized Fe-S radical SAM superfamily protein PflX
MGANYTPIQYEWFYYLEGEKTKLNWLLLETALEHFFRIRDSEALAAYREQYGDKQIAQFCAYYARRMKKSMLNYLQGRTKRVLHYRDYVDDFYPHHDGQLNRTLEDMAVEAWSHMLSACENCPQQCPYDHKARTALFDEWKD